MAAQGDSLMSVRAPVGDINIAFEDCCIGRGLAAVHGEHPSFVTYLLRSLKPRLDRYNGEGTVFGSISGKELKGLSVAIPDLGDIKSFEQIVGPIDLAIRSNECEMRCLIELRDTLLPELMSGEIDVSQIDLTQLNNRLSDC